ncbi:hypothetical protein C8Q80DRAFT_147475 [Daedaleopsis nitida]|nr:hypothetical protein C8Q80DRAFT_147475 [Daedaleopsis nitida]
MSADISYTQTGGGEEGTQGRAGNLPLHHHQPQHPPASRRAFEHRKLFETTDKELSSPIVMTWLDKVKRRAWHPSRDSGCREFHASHDHFVVLHHGHYGYHSPVAAPGHFMISGRHA